MARAGDGVSPLQILDNGLGQVIAAPSGGSLVDGPKTNAVVAQFEYLLSQEGPSWPGGSEAPNGLALPTTVGEGQGSVTPLHPFRVGGRCNDSDKLIGHAGFSSARGKVHRLSMDSPLAARGREMLLEIEREMAAEGLGGDVVPPRAQGIVWSRGNGLVVPPPQSPQLSTPQPAVNVAGSHLPLQQRTPQLVARRPPLATTAPAPSRVARTPLVALPRPGPSSAGANRRAGSVDGGSDLSDGQRMGSTVKRPRRSSFKSPMLPTSQTGRPRPAPSRTPARRHQSRLVSLFDVHEFSARPRVPLRDLSLQVEADDDDMPSSLTAAVSFALGDEHTVDDMQRTLVGLGARLDDGEGHAWVARHFAQVVLKLASMQRAFGLNGYLCAERVVRQLRYRYEREVVLNHRSALRRISEGDSNPSRHMVVFVAAVRGQGPGEVQGDRLSIQLSDGWSTMDAQLDEGLTVQLRKGRIRVGSKLSVAASELNGSRLALHLNGTRRARWHARLGFCRPLAGPLLHLRTLVAGGGTVPRLRVVVHRVYPLQSFERLASGEVILRDHAEEVRHAAGVAMAHAEVLQRWASAAGEAAEASARVHTINGMGRRDLASLAETATGKDLLAVLLALMRIDAGAFSQCSSKLSEAQLASMEKACGLPLCAAGPPERSTIPICRLAVSAPEDAVRASGAVGVVELTVWRPAEFLIDQGPGAVEGGVWELSGVDVCQPREPSLRLVLDADAADDDDDDGGGGGLAFALTATRGTTWLRRQGVGPASHPRRVLPLENLASLSAGDEVCVVGAIVQCSLWLPGEPAPTDPRRVFAAVPGCTQLLCVLVKGDGADGVLRKAVAGSVCGVWDVRYERLDEDNDIHIVHACDGGVTLAPERAAFAGNAVERLRTALQSDGGALAGHAHRIAGVLRLSPQEAPRSWRPSDVEPLAPEPASCSVCGARMPLAELEDHMAVCLCIGISQ